MANIKLTPEEVLGDIQNFESARSNMESAVHQMQGAVATMEGMWQGLGYNVYQGTMQQWNSDAQRILNDLQQLNQQVRNAVTGYEDTDSNAAAILGGLSF